jgi:hypothetical protein
MKQPWMMTSSDGDLVPIGEGVPHPRSYGTYPPKIREYVVDARGGGPGGGRAQHDLAPRHRVPRERAASCARARSPTWWCSTWRASTIRPPSATRTAAVREPPRAALGGRVLA